MTLYLIPTPLADNALHTLPAYVGEVVRTLSWFIAENPKVARRFVKSVDPVRPLQDMTFVALHDNEQAEEACALLRRAAEAKMPVGLLSDAGCPGVADPGAAVVAYAHRLGLRVVPLVGPSSLLLALMASGMNGQQFAFRGYLSPKRAELAADLRRLERKALHDKETQLFIETPYRTQMVVDTALECLQASTQFGVAQDLTGASEWIRSAPIGAWRKGERCELAKLPAVFMIGCG